MSGDGVPVGVEDYMCPGCMAEAYGLQPTQPVAWDALRQAARSLRTISEQAGKDEYMKDMLNVRGYAGSRATVAEAALAQHPAAVDGAISPADLCALSRVFNANNNLRPSRGQRINDWLGKHIAAALAAQQGGDT